MRTRKTPLDLAVRRSAGNLTGAVSVECREGVKGKDLTGMGQEHERRRLGESEYSPFLRSFVKKGRRTLGQLLEGDVGVNEALVWKTTQHVSIIQ